MDAYINEISIHAPPRGATARLADVVARRKISIHAPPRGATLSGGLYFVPPLISIHAPPRGATRQEASRICHKREFQFTPLREGRQRQPRMKSCKLSISIHAPPRGATAGPLQRTIASAISIHAPPRGATTAGRSPEKEGNFNSRPSARGDVTIDICRALDIEISIHAPPRGATSHAPSLCAVWQFQFTPLREGRRCACGVVGGMTIFQFTPLREGRRRMA